MTTIDFRQQSAQQIDQEKIKLEAATVAELKRIFVNIADDAANLYRIEGNINSQQLAENYKPEILKAIRDAYRKTIRKFGFSLRKTIELKHGIFFDVENKAHTFNALIERDAPLTEVVARDSFLILFNKEKSRILQQYKAKLINQIDDKFNYGYDDWFTDYEKKKIDEKNEYWKSEIEGCETKEDIVCVAKSFFSASYFDYDGIDFFRHLEQKEKSLDRWFSNMVQSSIRIIKQVVAIEDDNADQKFQEINNQFLLESSLFIANESEAQNDIIAETNTRMIDSAIAAGLAAFFATQQERQDELFDLQSRLNNIQSPRERRRIAAQIDRARRQMEAAISNQQAVVAQNIQDNILNVRKARSTIIAGQNIGLAEAWSRQKEAELIDDANLISAQGETLAIEKEWVAILDDRTRSSHANADGQVTGINQPYIVQGEALQYPRDPNGSAGNIIYCRCVSDNRVVTS